MKRRNLVLIFLVCLVILSNNICLASDDDPRFESGKDRTHQFITKQAIFILKMDKGKEVEKVLNEYKDLIIEYSDKPDEDETDHKNAYHFYNPYTGKNFLPGIMKASKETGIVRFTDHALKAVEYYNYDRELSMQELGRACHYLEDINVPHHSANKVAKISFHSQYEEFVEKNKNLYLIDHSTMYEKYPNLTFEEYCEKLFDDCAINSYKYIEFANASKGLKKEPDKKKWDYAARKTVPYAQEAMAAFLYRFLKEVKI